MSSTVKDPTPVEHDRPEAASWRRSRSGRRRGLGSKVTWSDGNISPHKVLRLWLWRLLVAAAVLGVWQGLAAANIINVQFQSSPRLIFDYLDTVMLTATFWGNVWTTVFETVVGFLIGSLAGIVLGLALYKAHRVYEVLSPYISGLNSIPRVALMPIFILWFGLGSMSKIAGIVSLDIFVLIIATLGAVSNIDPDLLRLGRIAGLSRWSIFFKVVLRWAVPGIFGGLELALVYAFTGAVVGEMIGSFRGLGNLVETYSSDFNIAGVFGVLAIVGVIAAAMAAGLRRIERYLTRYQGMA